MKYLMSLAVMAFAFGLFLVNAENVNAQSDKDIRKARKEYRKDVRDARKDYRKDMRNSDDRDDRRDARRDYRRDVRDARRDYRQSTGMRVRQSNWNRGRTDNYWNRGRYNKSRYTHWRYRRNRNN